jgi:hypothetical protein
MIFWFVVKGTSSRTEVGALWIRVFDTATLDANRVALSMSIDAANSAITRETGESLENALLCLSQELQAKGSAFVK